MRLDLFGRFRGRLDHHVLHRLLQLVEGAHLDLAHALAADAVLGRQVFQRLGLVDQTTLDDDVAAALELGVDCLYSFDIQQRKLAQTLRLKLN